MSDTQDTLVERLRAIQCPPRERPIVDEAATALADRDAKIAELERERDEARLTLAYCQKECQDTDRVTHSKMLDERQRAVRAESQVAELTQKLERAEQTVEFVARWAWRTDPPHASGKLADSDRLSCIKHHPVIKKAAAPHIELAEQEARPSIQEPPKMDEIDSKALEEVCRSTNIGFRDFHIPKNVIARAVSTYLTVSSLTSRLAALEDENKTLREALTEAREVVDIAAGHNVPAVAWAIVVRDHIDAALSKPAALPAEGNGESEADKVFRDALAGIGVTMVDADGKAHRIDPSDFYATPPAPQPLEGAVNYVDVTGWPLLPG